MHAYIHTCVHTYIHTFIFFYISIHIISHIYHILICLNISSCACACMYIHIYTCVYAFINNCAFFWRHIYIDKCMCICIYVETALAMQFFKHWFWNPQTQNSRVIEQILYSRIKHTIKSWISYFQPLRSNALNSAPVLKCSMFLKIQYLTYF